MANATDMNIPETFHRLKRTVVILSAALIVWGVSDHGAKSTVKLPWIESELSSGIVPWLIWLSAAYYLLGFLLETLVAVRLNTTAANKKDYKSVDEAMRAYIGGVGYTISQITGLTKRMGEECDRYLEARQHELTGASAIDAASRLPVTSHAIQTFERTGNQVIKHCNEVVQVMHLAHRDMSRLDRAITGQRRLSFWLWEVAGAIGVFVVASMVGWPPGQILIIWLAPSLLP